MGEMVITRRPKLYECVDCGLCGLKSHCSCGGITALISGNDFSSCLKCGDSLEKQPRNPNSKIKRGQQYLYAYTWQCGSCGTRYMDETARVRIDAVEYVPPAPVAVAVSFAALPVAPVADPALGPAQWPPIYPATAKQTSYLRYLAKQRGMTLREALDVLQPPSPTLADLGVKRAGEIITAPKAWQGGRVMPTPEIRILPLCRICGAGIPYRIGKGRQRELCPKCRPIYRKIYMRLKQRQWRSQHRAV